MPIKKYFFLLMFFMFCFVFGDSSKEQKQKEAPQKNSIFRDYLYDRYIAHKKILQFGSAALLFGGGIATFLYFFLKRDTIVVNEEGNREEDLGQNGENEIGIDSDFIDDDLNVDYESDEDSKEEKKEDNEKINDSTIIINDDGNLTDDKAKKEPEIVIIKRDENDKGSDPKEIVVYKPSREQIKKLLETNEGVYAVSVQYDSLKNFEDKKIFLEYFIDEYVEQSKLKKQMLKDWSIYVTKMLAEDIFRDSLLVKVFFFLKENYENNLKSMFLDFFKSYEEYSPFYGYQVYKKELKPHIVNVAKMIHEGSLFHEKEELENYFDSLVDYVKNENIKLDKELCETIVVNLVDSNKLTDFIIYLVSVMKRDDVSVATGTDFLSFITKPLIFNNENTKQPLIALQWNTVKNDFDFQKPEKLDQVIFDDLVERLDDEFIFDLKNELIFHQFKNLEVSLLQNECYLKDPEREDLKKYFLPYHEELKKYLDDFAVIYNKALFWRIYYFLEGDNDRRIDFDAILQNSYMNIEDAKKRAEICTTLYKYFQKALTEKRYRMEKDLIIGLMGCITLPMLSWEYNKVQEQDNFCDFFSLFFEIFEQDLNDKNTHLFIFSNFVKDLYQKKQLKSFFLHFLQALKKEGSGSLFDALFSSLLCQAEFEYNNIILGLKQIILNDLIHVPGALKSFLDFVKKKSFDDFFDMVTKPLIYKKGSELEPLMQFVWNDDIFYEPYLIPDIGEIYRNFDIKIPEIIEDESNQEKVLGVLKKYIQEGGDIIFFKKLLTKSYIEDLLLKNQSPSLVACLFNHVLSFCPESLQSLFFEEKEEAEVKKLSFKYLVGGAITTKVKAYKKLYKAFHNQKIDEKRYDIGFIANEAICENKGHGDVYFAAALLSSFDEQDFVVFLKRVCIDYIKLDLDDGYNSYFYKIFKCFVERLSSEDNKALKNKFLNVMQSNKHEIMFLDTFYKDFWYSNDQDINNTLNQLRDGLKRQKSIYVKKWINYLLYATQGNEWIEHNMLGHKNDNYSKLFFINCEGHNANVILEIFKIYKEYGGSLDTMLQCCNFNLFSSEKLLDVINCLLQEDPSCRWLQDGHLQDQLKKLYLENSFLSIKQLIFAKNNDLNVRKILKEIEKKIFDNQRNPIDYFLKDEKINDLFNKNVYFSSTKRLIFDQIYISLKKTDPMRDHSLIKKIKNNEQLFCVLFWDVLRKKEDHNMFDHLVDCFEGYREKVEECIIKNCNKNKARYDVFKKLISYRTVKKKNKEENLEMEIEFPMHTVNANLSKSLLMFLYPDEIDKIVRYHTMHIKDQGKNFKHIFSVFENQQEESEIFNQLFDKYWLEFFIYRKNNGKNEKKSSLDFTIKQKLQEKRRNEWYPKGLNSESLQKIKNYEKIFDSLLWPLEIEEEVYL